jgi:hypothetical protein
MKYLIALLLASPAMAYYSDVVYPCDNVNLYRPFEGRCAYPEIERQQAVPTAYSTQMQHYYDSIWSEPSKPQVIVIER